MLHQFPVRLSRAPIRNFSDFRQQLKRGVRRHQFVVLPEVGLAARAGTLQPPVFGYHVADAVEILYRNVFFRSYQGITSGTAVFCRWNFSRHRNCGSHGLTGSDCAWRKRKRSARCRPAVHELPERAAPPRRERLFERRLWTLRRTAPPCGSPESGGTDRRYCPYFLPGFSEKSSGSISSSSSMEERIWKNGYPALQDLLLW